MNPQQPRQLGDELLERVSALRLLGQALVQEVSDSAGRIAQTLDEVARVGDAVADNGCSPDTTRTREHAQRARRSAQDERHRQQRWSHKAEN